MRPARSSPAVAVRARPPWMLRRAAPMLPTRVWRSHDLGGPEAARTASVGHDKPSSAFCRCCIALRCQEPCRRFLGMMGTEPVAHNRTKVPMASKNSLYPWAPVGPCHGLLTFNSPARSNLSPLRFTVRLPKFATLVCRSYSLHNGSPEVDRP